VLLQALSEEHLQCRTNTNVCKSIHPIQGEKGFCRLRHVINSVKRTGNKEDLLNRQTVAIERIAINRVLGSILTAFYLTRMYCVWLSRSGTDEQKSLSVLEIEHRWLGARGSIGG
jgi:hypothetical protein